jgi:hypothetical protein
MLLGYELQARTSKGVWDGLKGYVTNTKLPAEEVIAN